VTRFWRGIARHGIPRRARWCYKNAMSALAVAIWSDYI